MMLEAQLFVVADEVLVEVLGRIRDDDRGIVLPPLSDLPGPSVETPLGTVVQQWAMDDACVPGVLGHDPVRVPHRLDRAAVVRLAGAACSAARDTSNGHALVHARYGAVSTRHYLLRLAVNRALVAHYVASYLGSTACPLPEELAHPLHDLTEPDADTWRRLGIFGDPMPVPHQASWRDTFLLTAGHLPHPLGH